MSGKWYSFSSIVDRGLVASLESACPAAHGIMLDVGCGSKPYAGVFRERVSCHWGIDLPVSASANKYEKRADVYADLRNTLPLLDCTVDTVLCTEVIEHHPQPGFLLGEVHRVLKPGGCLILTAPQTWGLHEAPHDYYRFTEYGLRYLAEQNGFDVQHLQHRGGIWATVAQRISSFLHFQLAAGKSPFVRGPVGLACCAILLLGRALDAGSGHKGDTLGHTMVARKHGVPCQDQTALTQR